MHILTIPIRQRRAPSIRRQDYLHSPPNDELFRDYGETKSVPVSMLGAGFLSSNFYPWRRRITPKIIENFPFFHAPRPMPRPHMIVGENYARMINRSHFVVGCGGASILWSPRFLRFGARSILVTQDRNHSDAGLWMGKIACSSTRAMSSNAYSIC